MKWKEFIGKRKIEIIITIVFLAIVGVLYLALWTIRRNYKNLKELNDKYDLYKTER